MSRLVAAGAALAGALSASSSLEAEPQRPGPGGPYHTRRLVMSQYSLMLINGPLSGAVFGNRIGDQNIDGGIFFTRSEPLRPDVPVTLGFYGGAVIGLLPNLELGALFIPAEVVGANNFQVQPVPVILTYSLSFGDVDVGARLGLHLGAPAKLLPGVPVRIRVGRTRLDTGIFPSVRFLSDAEGGTVAGLNAPIRVAYNLTPHWFVGLESGFAEPAFTVDHDEVIPLGLLGGWTFLWGKRVVDITTSFVWDNFLFVDPVSSRDAVQPGFFRANVGVNIQQQVL
jgi:hypothetical protein